MLLCIGFICKYSSKVSNREVTKSKEKVLLHRYISCRRYLLRCCTLHSWNARAIYQLGTYLGNYYSNIPFYHYRVLRCVAVDSRHSDTLQHLQFIYSLLEKKKTTKRDLGDSRIDMSLLPKLPLKFVSKLKARYYNQIEI